VILGEVNIGNLNIRITVCGAAAQFFTFECYKSHGNSITFNTGSGSFREYWSLYLPVFKSIAEGMTTVSIKFNAGE